MNISKTSIRIGCGFFPDSNDGVLTITGTINVGVTDILGTYRGVPLTRVTQSSLPIEISIPTFVSVNSSLTLKSCQPSAPPMQ